MARRKGNFLSGIIGKMRISIVKGRQILSSRPGKVKQAEATKKTGKTFGMASRLSSKIKLLADGDLAQLHDGTMSTRLNGELNNILQKSRDMKTMLFTFDSDSFSRLTGFDFNIDSKVNKRLSKMPETRLAGSQLIVSFPPLTIPTMLNFPHKSTQCELSIGISLFQLEEGLFAHDRFVKSIMIIKDNEETAAFDFTFIVPEGCFYIVNLFMEYYKPNNKGLQCLNTKKFNPACIVEAKIAPGKFIETDDFMWTKMVKFDQANVM